MDGSTLVSSNVSQTYIAEDHVLTDVQGVKAISSSFTINDRM
jgi:hypothetical protein